MSRPWLDCMRKQFGGRFFQHWNCLGILTHFKFAHHTTCCNYNFVGILREALQVNYMFVRGYLPVVTEERRKMCLPFVRDDSVLWDEIGKLMVSN